MQHAPPMGGLERCALITAARCAREHLQIAIPTRYGVRPGVTGGLDLS